MRGRRAGDGHARRAPLAPPARWAHSRSSWPSGRRSSGASADFAGGLLTRRLPVFGVTDRLAGCRLRRARSSSSRSAATVDGRSFAIGLLAGLGGGAGLAAFYRALSLGTMSVVSPIAACGAIVPFGLSLATGERPGAIALVGAVRRTRRSRPRLDRGAPVGGARAGARGGACGRRGRGARALRLLPRPRQPRGRPVVDALRRAGWLARTAARRRGGAARAGPDPARVPRGRRRGRPRGRRRRTRSSPSRAATACSRSSRCSARSTRSSRSCSRT